MALSFSDPMTPNRHRMTATKLSSGAWIVECFDCPPSRKQPATDDHLKIPALNHKDADVQIDLHRRVVAEKVKQEHGK